MKLLKSDCGNAWLFDCQIKDGWIETGLACFLPLPSDILVFTIKGKVYTASAPPKAMNKAGAVRIVNARLPLFD
jgi:hypothetical protein